MVLAALAAVKPANTGEIRHLPLAHVVRPAVDRVSREVAVAAEFDAVGEQVVVAAAVVADVGVGAHAGREGLGELRVKDSRLVDLGSRL